jgi:GTPase Era involved in 16S rRNA processing
LAHTRWIFVAYAHDVYTIYLRVYLVYLQVSRESQKAIVIGKGGLKLKEVGTAARTKLEEVTFSS